MKTFSLSLPFKVEDEETEVYASITDFTDVTNMQLFIYAADSTKKGYSTATTLLASSVPSKYF